MNWVRFMIMIQRKVLSGIGLNCVLPLISLSGRLPLLRLRIKKGERMYPLLSTFLNGICSKSWKGCEKRAFLSVSFCLKPDNGVVLLLFSFTLHGYNLFTKRVGIHLLLLRINPLPTRLWRCSLNCWQNIHRGCLTFQVIIRLSSVRMAALRMTLSLSKVQRLSGTA